MGIKSSAVKQPPEKPTKYLHVVIPIDSMDRLHRYAEQLAKDRGWTSCSLQKAVLHLIDSVPLAKPAERVRAGRRDKSQVG